MTVVVLIAAPLIAFQKNPDLLPQAVDVVRSLFGPDVAAWIESTAFQAQDQLTQLKVRLGGQPPELVVVPTGIPAANPVDDGSVAGNAILAELPKVDLDAPIATATLEPATTLPADTGLQANEEQRSHGRATPPAPIALTPQSGLRGAGGNASSPLPPTIGNGLWQPLTRTLINNIPVMSETVLYPDPARPYAQAIVVSIDLRRAALHLLPGSQEPASKVEFPRSGLIPAGDKVAGRLLAAFNGGFKAVNGQYGIGVDGVTLLPPRNGMATIGFFKNGSVRIGTWGKDIQPSPDMPTWRQNCPPLIQAGKINPQVDGDGPEWGRTIQNAVITWRSGLGLSADRQTAYYTMGNNLSAHTLARVLESVGASDAMQLDINSYWVRFVTFGTSANGLLNSIKLVPSMAGDSKQFLTADTRDFFYVVAK